MVTLRRHASTHRVIFLHSPLACTLALHKMVSLFMISLQLGIKVNHK